MTEQTPPRRLTAADFDQELLDLYDYYVHGKITKRDFLDRAGFHPGFLPGPVTKHAGAKALDDPRGYEGLRESLVVPVEFSFEFQPPLPGT